MGIWEYGYIYIYIHIYIYIKKALVFKAKNSANISTRWPLIKACRSHLAGSEEIRPV